ncbi:pyridoxal phosphate-dependent aminotransferase [Portibacter lacus]|nr:histidinol-phosphate transaminase [Portibacter lacus]
MAMQRRTWLKTIALTSAGSVIARNLDFTQPRISTSPNTSRFLEWENSPYKDRIPALKARLLANENPYGPSEAAKEAIIDSVSMGNRYGHKQAQELIEMLAAKEGVTPDHIMLGPGSSDLLEKVGITHFLEGGNIVAADPTYMSIINTAKSFNAEWKAVKVKENWEYDLDAMKAAIDDKTKLVYICNPNNPTATITPADKIWKFCEEVADKKPVFVDEAYLEFMEPEEQKSMVGLVNKGKNVIISRTFSKVYGMAGIRVGYIVALPSTLEKIEHMVRSNMGLNITALHAAIASLKDENFVSDSIAKNAECRSYVCDELSSMNIKYVPSQTSFILFPIAMDGKPFLKEMFDLQVGVRAFQIFDQSYCRVSMGTMTEMKMFMEALKKVIA